MADAPVIPTAPPGKTVAIRGMRRLVVAAWREGAIVGGTVNGRLPGPDGWRRLDDDIAPSAAMRRAPAYLVLPKSSYVLRDIELPAASAHDTERMLALEAGTNVPDELAPVETGHVALEAPGERDGFHRFEIYAARRATLLAAQAAMTERSMRAPCIVPSALLWRWMLARLAPDTVVAMETGEGTVELARLDAVGTLTVRTAHLDAASLGEALRPLLPPAGAIEDGPDGMRDVPWIGPHWPAEDIGPLRFVDARDVDALTEIVPHATEEPMLATAALLLRQHARDVRLRTANLLPSSLGSALAQRRQRRRLVTASACLLAALLFLVGALHARVYRLDRALAQLQQETEHVRAAGRLVGIQLEQLRQVHAAQRTVNDLQDVVGGVLDATPEGVAYSRLALQPDGRLDMEAHAASLSVLYTLPERLESVPAFTDVSSHGAGQRDFAGGAVAEYRLSARLQRSPRP